MDINPVHARTLQAIVRSGSFSRAAETLHLSQPAVSHHIRHLEEAVGAPLLERLGRRVVATPAGELLVAHASRAFRELEAARDAIRAGQGRVAGRVSVGTGATASIYLLPPLLRGLRRRHPALEVVVVTRPVTSRALAVSPFFVDRLVAIAPPGGPRRRRAPLTPAQLAQQPLILYERGGNIRLVVDNWFRRGRAVPHVTMELGNAEATKKLVSAGLGWSIVSEIAVRAEAKSGALDVIALTPALHRDLAVVHRRDKATRPALHAVLAALTRHRKSSPRPSHR